MYIANQLKILRKNHGQWTSSIHMTGQNSSLYNTQFQKIQLYKGYKTESTLNSYIILLKLFIYNISL